jgi:hypothetical protein
VSVFDSDVQLDFLDHRYRLTMPVMATMISLNIRSLVVENGVVMNVIIDAANPVSNSVFAISLLVILLDIYILAINSTNIYILVMNGLVI